MRLRAHRFPLSVADARCSNCILRTPKRRRKKPETGTTKKKSVRFGDETTASRAACRDFYFDMTCQIRMPSWTKGREVIYKLVVEAWQTIINSTQSVCTAALWPGYVPRGISILLKADSATGAGQSLGRCAVPGRLVSVVALASRLRPGRSTNERVAIPRGTGSPGEFG